MIQSSTWIVVQSYVTALNYTVTGLTAGQTYTFRISVTNVFGYSQYSNSLAVLCGSAPSVITTTSVQIINSNVFISWSQPTYINGAPILYYTIQFLTINGVSYS